MYRGVLHSVDDRRCGVGLVDRQRRQRQTRFSGGGSSGEEANSKKWNRQILAREKLCFLKDDKEHRSLSVEFITLWKRIAFFVRWGKLSKLATENKRALPGTSTLADDACTSKTTSRPSSSWTLKHMYIYNWARKIPWFTIHDECHSTYDALWSWKLWTEARRSYRFHMH